VPPACAIGPVPDSRIVMLPGSSARVRPTISAFPGSTTITRVLGSRISTRPSVLSTRMRFLAEVTIRASPTSVFTDSLLASGWKAVSADAPCPRTSSSPPNEVLLGPLMIRFSSSAAQVDVPKAKMSAPTTAMSAVRFISLLPPIRADRPDNDDGSITWSPATIQQTGCQGKSWMRNNGPRRRAAGRRHQNPYNWGLSWPVEAHPLQPQLRLDSPPSG